MATSKLPLLPIQQRLWFLQQLESYGRDDIISLAYQVPVILSQEQVQQRLTRVIDTYDTLRVVVSADSDSVAQEISPSAEKYGIYVTTLNANAAPPNTLEQCIAYARQAVAGQVSGPLLRVDLVHTPNSHSYLLVTAHRLISDVESLEHVAACLLGENPELVAPTTSFASYINANGTDKAAALDKWVKLLDDATHVCEMPLDKTRPTVQQGSIASYAGQFSADTLSHVGKLAQQYSVPQPAVWMATYLTLLYRYTLQDDILIGLAQRSSGPTIPAVGPFTDIAVIRQQFAEGITFARLLAMLNTIYVDAVSAPPFPLLLEALKPERDLSRAPVVQHGFAYQNVGAASLTSARVHASAALYQLDLMLHVRAEHDRATADWHFDSALFEESTIQRMHRHLEALIASTVAGAESPVSRLSLITPEEHELITVTWNKTTNPVKDNDFVYRLFEKQAARTPHAIAAREPSREITYDALNRRANRLAHYLAEMGIGADTVVALLADRDIDYLTAILAVNKAGGAFLPLSPTYPAKRMASIFEKSQTPLVLVGKNYLAAIQESVQYMAAEQRPTIEVVPTLLEQDRPEDNLPTRCGMNDLAYVMFTSGSTGEPKGVMVHHAGMINHNYAKNGDLGMGVSDVLAQTSRQSFDIVVWQFLAPLIVGGSIFIVPDDMALDPAQLLKATDQYQITVLQLVPVNIEALLDVADAMGEQRPALKSLRWMVPTGDALQTDLCRRWLRLYPHTRMLNTYGATECSDDQCHYVIDAPPPATYRPTVMTIGRPIINTQVYILDDLMRPVPIGVVGELYIAGVGVGRGYLRDLERTQKTFVPNPFSSDPNARLYRSGDQARYLSDGTVEFLGRIGHLIKIRGIRIEPGEIQAVLSRHPQVSQATLIVHEFPNTGAQLVAYVVYRKDEVVAEADLRTYLRQQLPDYMIPAHFVVLNTMPLNANGKIDRKALPIPKVAKAQTAIVAPRNDVETSLLEIWRKVLNRDELSIHDNFFDAGGNSLLAMRLFSQVERQFGQRLPLATIFRATTIADQAELLSGSNAREHVTLASGLTCVVPIHVGSSERPPFFCVHALGGHVLYFRELARYLGKDQTFYGIQALGIDGNHKPITRYEDLAAVYVREIRTVQPEGPYYIGGECLGGTVAFEVVRQLEEQGQTVKLFVMFDAFCGGDPTLRPGWTIQLYESMFHMKRFTRLYIPRLRGNTSLRQKLGIVTEAMQNAVLIFKRIFLSRWLAKADPNDPLNVVQDALIEGQEAYTVGCIRTPITLFNSELPWGVTGDETLGWHGHTTGGINIERFTNLFDLLIEGPDVNLTAARLRKILDEKFAEKEVQLVPVSVPAPELVA